MKRLAYIRGLTSFSSATELESVTLQAIGEEIIMYIHEVGKSRDVQMWKQTSLGYAVPCFTHPTVLY